MGTALQGERGLFDPAGIDPEIDALYPDVTPTRVEIALRDGRVLASPVDTPKGDPRAPLSEAELRAKFRENAGMALGVPAVTALEAAILGFEHQPSVHAALAPVRARLGPMAPAS
ncbi:MAG: MmgE/PrpD family protein [Burkholderiales bacterium]|nr:MmgE/PrpD family protein [Burkholderiales bacterium]